MQLNVRHGIRNRKCRAMERFFLIWYHFVKRKGSSWLFASWTIHWVCFVGSSGIPDDRYLIHIREREREKGIPKEMMSAQFCCCCFNVYVYCGKIALNFEC